MSSHPLGVKPVASGSLPLDENGGVQCITCHAPDAQSHLQARASHTPMLRDGMTPAALCRQCHQASASRASAHAMALGKAHMTRPVTKWAGAEAQKAAKESAGDLARSQFCLGCHDGTISTDAFFSNSAAARNPLRQHPVGVKYPSEGKPDSDSRLRPVSMLDRRIELTDGQVNCQSCHSLYSRENRLLVTSGPQHQLCLSCHAM